MALQDLLDNRWLLSALLALLLAQALKVALKLLRSRRWEMARLLESGGLPGSRSALLAALSSGVGLTQGLGSPLFAACAVCSLALLWQATQMEVRPAGLRAAAILSGMLLGVLAALVAFVWTA